MENVKSVFMRISAFFTAIIIALTSLSFGNNFNIKKPDGALLTVAMIADTHMGAQFYREMIFAPCVRDIGRNVQPDVLLVAGDCVDNGNDENWTAFKKIVEKNIGGDVEKVLAIGNHDTWSDYDGEHEYDEARKLFLKYAGDIMGAPIDEVYYTREIGGYSFIVMGSEDSSTDATISEKQLEWVDAELRKASAKSAGKPIFVVNHQPLNYTHTVGANEHHNGFSDDEISQKLRDILNKYENVLLISGHQHYELRTYDPDNETGFTTVEKIGGGVYSVNLPSSEYGSFFTGGTGVLGEGVVLTVFENRVELQGRNHFLSNRIDSFKINIPLK